MKNEVSEIIGPVFRDPPDGNPARGDPMRGPAGPRWGMSVAGRSPPGSAAAPPGLGRSAGRRLERADFLRQIFKIQRKLP